MFRQLPSGVAEMRAWLYEVLGVSRGGPKAQNPIAKTIGIVVVAALTASVASVFPTITATGRWIKSATSPGSPILQYLIFLRRGT